MPRSKSPVYKIGGWCYLDTGKTGRVPKTTNKDTGKKQKSYNGKKRILMKRCNTEENQFSNILVYQQSGHKDNKQWLL